jgi:hypothetical protein
MNLLVVALRNLFFCGGAVNCLHTQIIRDILFWLRYLVIQIAPFGIPRRNFAFLLIIPT